MTGDFHIHTFFSPCADPAMSFGAILDAARAAGLEEIGLTDHPYRDGLDRHHEALAHARARLDGDAPRVWIGAELEVIGLERLILPRAALPRADYIVAAPSHYDLVHFPPVPHFGDPVEWADRLLTDMENVPGSGADVIAHPFFVHALHLDAPESPRLPALADVLGEMRPRRVRRLLERIAEDGVALELTPRLTWNPVFLPFAEDFYRQALALGIRFATGSDSHRATTIGDLGDAAAFADRVGIGPEHLWRPGPRD